MAGKVVHCKKEKYDVYIGRPSKWGNPFVIEGDKEKLDPKFVALTRIEAVNKYVEWFMKQPKLMNEARKELKGKILGCWCKPRLCHGDFLVQFVESIDWDEEDKTLHPRSGGM